jgi:hypothetical protein
MQRRPAINLSSPVLRDSRARRKTGVKVTAPCRVQRMLRGRLTAPQPQVAVQRLHPLVVARKAAPLLRPGQPVTRRTDHQRRPGQRRHRPDPRRPGARPGLARLRARQGGRRRQVRDPFRLRARQGGRRRQVRDPFSPARRASRSDRLAATTPSARMAPGRRVQGRSRAQRHAPRPQAGAHPLQRGGRQDTRGPAGRDRWTATEHPFQLAGHPGYQQVAARCRRVRMAPGTRLRIRRLVAPGPVDIVRFPRGGARVRTGMLDLTPLQKTLRQQPDLLRNQDLTGLAPRRRPKQERQTRGRMW